MTKESKIREGEGFNESALTEYLQRVLPDGCQTLETSQFVGGASNLTYLLKTENAELVLRRPPFGNQVKSAHDMRREFDVLSALNGNFSASPKPIHFCSDESVIGSEFYLMERVKGQVIRNEWPFEETRESLENSARSFVKTLAELHSLDWKSIGLEEFGKPEGYVERQVKGWSKRYFKAKTDEWPDIEKVIEWLNERIPPETEGVLVHNDYKYDNVVFEEGSSENVVAVLDWEMSTIGSPLMDLGTTLGYWMSKDAGEELLSMPFNPRILMENISRDELVSIYAEASRREVGDINYYYIFGTLKIAVIAQQIYYRYAKGFTKDKRFSVFNRFVGALGGIAANSLKD